MTAASQTAQATSSQTIAAGTSATNLPTETVWPGSQNPPYICCWSSQGQYVTFAFDVAAGSTTLTLRYSAGNGPASRTTELDGALWAANQSFPATADWSTWTTLARTTTLTAGAHTFKIWHDATAGSTNYINLDNLTITQGTPPPPPPLRVAVGYADSSSGLTPWSGSADTTFIGEPAQCCSTHGPDNGSAGYDAGAIEITNTATSAINVDAVTVDFGGGSRPSHFDLWGGGTGTTLPRSLTPGAHLVLTMTSSFNFDTSDLFGEACHINSRVVPVVHVTANGVTTDYSDDHQTLNSDGADLASCPGDISEQVAFRNLSPGVQPATPPVDDLAPSRAGVAIEGRVLSGFAGGWNASPPPALALVWIRCDTNGANCAPITGAISPTYRPTVSDVGHTLRLHVTATNASGVRGASSAPTAIVQSGPTIAQLGDTSTGFTSKLIDNPTELGSLFTAATSGTTTDFEFFARGAGNTQTFTPKIYAQVNGARGPLLATGTTVTVPRGTNGTWYVSTLAGLQLNAGHVYDLALDPSGIFNGTYVGAETNGTNAFFVDYTP